MNTLTIAGWASTPVVDQSNEFIEASVLDMSTYDLNPVLMFCHDHKSPPIGIAKHYRLKPYTSGFRLFGFAKFCSFNASSLQIFEMATTIAELNCHRACKPVRLSLLMSLLDESIRSGLATDILLNHLVVFHADILPVDMLDPLADLLDCIHHAIENLSM